VKETEYVTEIDPALKPPDGRIALSSVRHQEPEPEAE
jgi:hypothetical protein